jgi:transcriptional regulator with XRE-family HTH domain
MSIESDVLEPETLFVDGAPELSLLGKRIELLRIERGLSKQALARRAGTSRQQLWRVMTGKSELTSSLCLRLSEVLRIDARTLRDPAIAVHPLAFVEGFAATPAPPPFDAWLADPDHLVRALSALPTGPHGRLMRLDLVAAVEHRAREAALPVPGHLNEIRRRLVTGEL